MVIKAKNDFNHGGIVSMKRGDVRSVDDEVGKHLVSIGVAVETKITHKKIKIKDESFDKAKKQSEE